MLPLPPRKAAALAKDTAKMAKQAVEKLLDDPVAYATAYESRKTKKAAKVGSGLTPPSPPTSLTPIPKHPTCPGRIGTRRSGARQLKAFRRWYRR